MSTMVFVFGTLKEGFPNFSINEGARMHGRFVTEQRYPLYLVGERFTPWMIDSAGDGEQVAGEVYEVSESELVRMDELERITEPDGYRRELIRVVSQGDGPAAPMTVFAYLKPAGQLDGQQVHGDPLTEYETRHAKLYVPRPENCT